MSCISTGTRMAYAQQQYTTEKEIAALLQDRKDVLVIDNRESLRV